MTEMESISRVRSAATWMRKSARPLDQYPKRAGLSSREAAEAQRFASGMFPWPKKWTKHLYELARG